MALSYCLSRFFHPTDPTIRGVSHVMWTDAPSTNNADSRNAVFYGDKAIDRSPCGTGSSARMAQLSARGKLKTSERFRHEGYIGSIFDCHIEDTVTLGDHQTIMPSISGWARMTAKTKFLWTRATHFITDSRFFDTCREFAPY